MAVINGSNGAVYLYQKTGIQLLEGNMDGYAALGNGEQGARCKSARKWDPTQT